MTKAWLGAPAALITSMVTLAQQGPPAGGPPGGAPGGAGGGAPPAMSTAKLDHAPIFASLDTNKDGKVSSDEWTKAGLPDMIYGMIDSGKTNALTLAAMNASSPPDAIDANKDGKITLEEMKTFTASMGAGGPPGGGAPAGGPPPGGTAPGK